MFRRIIISFMLLAVSMLSANEDDPQENIDLPTISRAVSTGHPQGHANPLASLECEPSSFVYGCINVICEFEII